MSFNCLLSLLILISVYDLRASEGCEAEICASIVSKCLLIESCKCDFANSTCVDECFNCLDDLFTDCCSCLDAQPQQCRDRQSQLLELSHFW